MAGKRPVTALSKLLDAQTGVLHRDLTHALQVVSALEREIHQGISADIPAPERAVIEAAKAYCQACERDDASAMTKTFFELGLAISLLNGDGHK